MPARWLFVVSSSYWFRISFSWLVTGAIAALLLLIWSIATLVKARRLNRELIAAYKAEMAKAKEDEDTETDEDETEQEAPEEEQA